MHFEQRGVIGKHCFYFRAWEDCPVLYKEDAERVLGANFRHGRRANGRTDRLLRWQVPQTPEGEGFHGSVTRWHKMRARQQARITSNALGISCVSICRILKVPRPRSGVYRLGLLYTDTRMAGCFGQERLLSLSRARFPGPRCQSTQRRSMPMAQSFSERRTSPSWSLHQEQNTRGPSA